MNPEFELLITVEWNPGNGEDGEYVVSARREESDEWQVFRGGNLDELLPTARNTIW